jgi:glycosyltransferase involved in cell wall biosynthesis
LTRIHQVLSGAGPVDAVTTQAFEYQRLFRDWRVEGDVYAAFADPAIRSRVAPLSRLRPDPKDLVLFHYSAYAPRLEPLLDLPQRKLLVYHNVTPARYLWRHQPHVAALCALGRDHLPRWAAAVDVAAAVSEYNALELREAGADDVRIVPILLDPERLRSGIDDDGGGRGAGHPVVLSVGRVAPHKRPELVLQAFELYRSSFAAEARLHMVGEPLSPAYAASVRELAGPGVELTGRLPQPRLNELWQRADVMVSLSDHEGFCVPLLEAFHAGVPVIARPAGGMPEVGGDAVLWVDDGDPAVVAELIDLAVRDDELRAELVARGRARAAEYSPERAAGRLREAVDAALSA